MTLPTATQAYRPEPTAVQVQCGFSAGQVFPVPMILTIYGARDGYKACLRSAFTGVSMAETSYKVDGRPIAEALADTLIKASDWAIRTVVTAGDVVSNPKPWTWLAYGGRSLGVVEYPAR